MDRAQIWRIVAFVAGLFSCLVSGTLYGFGSFAPSMQDVFQWDQTSINLVGSVGDIGLYLGFTMGIVYDLTSPMFTMLLGSGLQGLGFLMMALATKKLFVCPWPLMAFFLFLVGQGSFATYTAGYAPSLFNFGPQYRSRTMSMMVASFAASSMLFSLVFRFGFRVPPKDPMEQVNLTNFLFTLAGATCFTSLVCAFLVKKVGPRENSDLETSKTAKLTESTAPDVFPLRLVFHLNFWLAFVILFFIAGPGLLWITVQGSFAKSLGEPAAVDNLVLLLGSGSIIGRLIMGFVSDFFVNRLSRSFFYIPAAVVMMAAHLLVAFFPAQMLYPSSFLTGFAYGMGFATSTVVMSSLFGKKYCGTNIGVISIAPAIAGIIYTTINGHLVDAGYGYSDSFIISGSTASIALGLGILLFLRTPPTAKETVPSPINPEEIQSLLN